jgi:hypothetical protein
MVLPVCVLHLRVAVLCCAFGTWCTAQRCACCTRRMRRPCAPGRLTNPNAGLAYPRDASKLGFCTSPAITHTARRLRTSVAESPASACMQHVWAEVALTGCPNAEPPRAHLSRAVCACCACVRACCVRGGLLTGRRHRAPRSKMYGACAKPASAEEGPAGGSEEAPALQTDSAQVVP